MYANLIAKMNDFLYQPYVVPLFLIVAGIIFTCCTKGVQLRCLKETFRVISEKPKDKNHMSSYQALMVSTASRVGTGNIIGVSTALCMGGAGAIFWLWVTAILGSASAFIESTLAQIYKRKRPDGGSYGGPSYYMETGLKSRLLGVIFAVIIILTYAVGYNMLAAYNLQSCFQSFEFYNESTPMVIGIILATFFGIIVTGGAKKLANVTSLLVPVMGIIYIGIAIFVMLVNFKNIPTMFSNIFASAFDFKAISGGFFGSCVMWGIKRGLYSNEAGMGSAPNAAASATVSHPVKQGLVQMFSVFLDSLVICTATAFMLLSTGVAPADSLSGAPYVTAAMNSALGSFGAIFIAVSLSLFAFTTLIGNYYYCEGCFKYLLKINKKPDGWLINSFRVIATNLVLIGAMLSAGLAWDTADMLQGLMVVINIPVILILMKPALAALEDYMKQRKDKPNKEPIYVAKKNGVKEKLEFWK